MGSISDIFRFHGDTHPVTHYTWDDFVDLQEKVSPFVEGLREAGKYTPDYPKLQKKNHHYFFIYGTLKKDFPNHRLIKNQELVSFGYTEKSCYFLANTIGNNKTINFPILFNTKEKDFQGRVYGQIFKIETPLIRDLDTIESNGIMYHRSLIDIEALGKDTSVPQKIRCWTYMGDKPFWIERKDSIRPLRKFKPVEGLPYYCFTKADL